MPRFRKRPVEVEAVQWTGENLDDIMGLARGEGTVTSGGVRLLFICDDDSEVEVGPGDWFVRDGDQFSVVDDADFAATFEPVEERDPGINDPFREVKTHIPEHMIRKAMEDESDGIESDPSAREPA